MLWRQATAAEKRGAMARRLMRGMPTGRTAGTSRKSAFCSRYATEKRILARRLTEKRILTVREIAECVFP